MQKPVFRKRNTERSREVRRSASPAEKLLWSKLCRGQINSHRFTTQFQIGDFYGDIVCRKQKLVVEVDGWSHEVRQEYDARRDHFMNIKGYRVLRFTNEEVVTNLEGVVITIALALLDPPSPSPVEPLGPVRGTGPSTRKREGS